MALLLLDDANGNSAVDGRGLMWQKWQNSKDAPAVFECSYSSVEAALVQTYSVRKRDLGRFRARITFLQKGGVFGVSPGKGKALRYTPDLMRRVIFTTELAEFGVNPSIALALVKARWETRLRKILQDADHAATIIPGPNGENTDRDIILHLDGVRLMTDAWSSAIPNINSCELRKLPDHMAMRMRMLPDDPSGLPPRALVTNLSMRFRAFQAALGPAYMEELRAERRAAAKHK
jgi:hypothetical protein